jgi:hypothetical protein
LCDTKEIAGFSINSKISRIFTGKNTKIQKIPNFFFVKKKIVWKRKETTAGK